MTQAAKERYKLRMRTGMPEKDTRRRRRAPVQDASQDRKVMQDKDASQDRKVMQDKDASQDRKVSQEQMARRKRRREAARKKREQQVRTRLTVLAVIIVLAVAGIGAFAFRVHKKNVQEEEAAIAASHEVQKRQEEAALEASRQAAEEEAALEASRQAAKEEAALAASRKAAEEEAAKKAAKKAAEEKKAKAEEEKIPGLSESYDFKVTKKTEDVPEDIDSGYAVIVDLVSGNVIAERDCDTDMFPASMTKILTLLVAVENIDPDRLDSDTYEIHQDITNYVYTHEMSQVGWNIGDTPTIRSLLYGTILPSGADAAIALAEYTAGSEEEFVELMNKKLEELGISDTAHFTNVVGAFDEDHYCTCLDMATILRAAIDNELCREVLSCRYYEVERSLDEDSEYIGISNWFLRRIEDKDTHGTVVCGKTGYTSEAGFCAASYQESDDGGHYICVTADAPGTWQCIYDHVELYETYTE